eukprot:scaffold3128_cov300-Prasinococcus_capsulatus_cf.AAC.1
MALWWWALLSGLERARILGNFRMACRRLLSLQRRPTHLCTQIGRRRRKLGLILSELCERQVQLLRQRLVRNGAPRYLFLFTCGVGRALQEGGHLGHRRQLVRHRGGARARPRPRPKGGPSFAGSRAAAVLNAPRGRGAPQVHARAPCTASSSRERRQLHRLEMFGRERRGGRSTPN